jgi:hypothetical protein
MLKLRRGRLAATAVPLPGGAVIFIRPATAFEVDRAAIGAERMLAGLVEGQTAAASILDVLGDEFREADFTTRGWIAAAAQRIALLELAAICAERLDGVIDDNDRPITVPGKEVLVLLLRDAECGRRIATAINARVHEEVAEGNASAVSPDGAAKAAEDIAPAVAPMTPPAQAAASAPPESAAPK